MRPFFVMTLGLATLGASGCDKSGERPGQSAASPSPAAAPSDPVTPSTAKPVVAGSGPPKWTAEQLVHDFGERWAGDIVTYPFRISNEGGATLQILEAKPRCSCTVAENYSREIAPGATGTIPFKLNTGGKKGSVDEYLTVKTNDPVRPELTLRVRGIVHVVVDVEVVADAVADAASHPKEELEKIKGAGGSFGTIQRDQRLQRTLKLRNASGSPLTLKLVGVQPDGSRFTASLQETVPGEEFMLTITGDPPFQTGASSATLVLETNIVGRPLYRIMLYTYVPDRIDISPDLIAVDPRYPYIRERKISISNYGDKPLMVTALGTSDPRFKLNLEHREAKLWVVYVVLPEAPFAPPSYGEVIRIETNDAQKKIIDIPVLPSVDKPATLRPDDKPLKIIPVTLPS